MFYTLASKLPIISTDKSNKKFFKIFLIGSIIYILIHYYLHIKERNVVLEKLKNYMYYIMGIDLMVAYFLSKFTKSDETKEDIETNYTSDEKEDIMQQLQEYQRLNQLKEQKESKNVENSDKDTKEIKTSEKQKEESSQESPFIKQSKSDESNESKHMQKTKKKDTPTSDKSKKKIETDTHIPVYMGDG